MPNAEVTLPGSTCATCDPKELSPANTWTPQNLASLVEQLGGAIVVTHSQSGIMGHHMARILKERGHLDLLKGLMTLEGSCSLPNSGLTAADFDNIPYMALKGDYTATSNVCQDDRRRHQRAARRQAGNGEGRIHQAGRDGHPRRDAHDDARQEEPRDRRRHARLGRRERVSESNKQTPLKT